tara:strand:- start:291 stop:473 length:183 start_codon:yes stop_codon:yes gene_type:complete
MIAFARAKARSIFSQLRLKAVFQNQIKIEDTSKNNEQSEKKEEISNNFLDAIKRGGIWLS